MAKARIQKYLDAASLLRCPICGSELAADDPSLRCPKGHSFTVSAKGFVTFVGNCAPLKGYDTPFFESRARIMDAGFYAPVVRALGDIVLAHQAHGPIVDAGCGEGTYAKHLHRTTGAPVIALDYAKDAIRCAARGANDVLWLVADLANIPVADHSVGCVVNVFTPANYAEFSRVLTPDGLLIKVVPAELHMQELRQAAHKQLKHADYSNEDIVAHFERHAQLIDRKRVTHTQEVHPQQVDDVLRMSPVSFDIDSRALDTTTLTHITVDAEILVGRPS